MKFTLFFVAIALLSILFGCEALKELPERARSGAAYKEYLKKFNGEKLAAPLSIAKSWNAKVDNFANSTNTFAQRYYVNDQYYKPGSPVFFEIGGEGTLGGAPGGYIQQLGSQYSALLVALEHRFYGESIPNGNANTDNLKYLTVAQALGDLAAFTEWFTSSYGTGSSKWFVFGGSYPGALSSWYRSAYPSMSVGSLSSSGVTNCIVDYYQFDQQVSAAIGNQCADQIKRVQAAFERKIATGGPAGFTAALNLFHCEADMSVNDFYYMIADSWSMADQYGSKSSLCAAIAAAGEAASDELLMTTFADFSNGFWGNDFCSMGFYNSASLADPKRWDVNSRSWRWQTCYEVSYFNTAPSSGSLRGQSVNLEYHLQQCAQVFGKEMFPSSIAMNQKFGGDVPHAHNVFYSDFSDDPWQRASVNYPVSSDQPYFLTQCDNCGHCMDFHAATPTEPVQLQKSRAEFERYLKLWLA